MKKSGKAFPVRIMKFDGFCAVKCSFAGEKKDDVPCNI